MGFILVQFPQAIGEFYRTKTYSQGLPVDPRSNSCFDFDLVGGHTKKLATLNIKVKYR